MAYDSLCRNLRTCEMLLDAAKIAFARTLMSVPRLAATPPPV